ncbi:MAG: hypothetical protein PUK48_02545 [Spirochaetales bacterium]|nr:hypothetical protein [Spirochaetales bacterium]
MSTIEITSKIEALKEWEAVIEEAQAEAEALKDAIKAEMLKRDTEELEAGAYIIRWTSVLSIEKHSQIANVVVYSGSRNRFSEIATALRKVLLLRLLVGIKCVFASLLQIGDISSDYTLRYLIDLSDIQLIIAPSFKEAQRVLVALQCLCSQLSASAINHELINLIFDA